MLQIIWKWLFCSWAHYRNRCYPTVWDEDDAIEMGIPYNPNHWHCSKCHPCGEELDKLFKMQKG